MPPDDKNAVTAAEIIRNFGFWQAKALTEPVVVTHHGRPRLVLQSVEAYEQSRQAAGAAMGGSAEGEAAAIFSSLLNHMTEGFAGYDADLRVVEMNLAYARFYGLAREEAIGKTFVEAFPDAERSITHDRLLRTVRTGQSFQFETQSAVQTGRRIAVNIFPFRDGAGLLFMNMTDQARLSENQDRYAALTRALETCSAVASGRLDSRARVLELMGDFAGWLGLEKAELETMRLYDFVVSRDRRRLQDAFETAWESREPREVQAAFMRRGGEDVELLITFSPLVHDFAVQGALMVATTAG